MSEPSKFGSRAEPPAATSPPAPLSAHAPESALALSSVARPRQVRSEQSLQRLLDATEALLEHRPFARLSIADIARRARSSVGGFYARFRDKDELLLALHERFERRLQAELTRLEAELDPSAGLRGALAAGLTLLMESYAGQEQLLRAFAASAHQNRRLGKAASLFRQAITQRATQLLLKFHDELSHPEPQLAAGFAVQLALALLEQSLLRATSTSGAGSPAQVPGTAIDTSQLHAELERALLGYLTAPVSVRSPP